MTLTKMFAFVIIIFILSNAFVDSVIVNTSLGQIKGNNLYFADKNKTISVFQSIPYAKPPKGDLRFKASQPVDKWSGVLDGTQPRSACMQPTGEDMDEDCLFLNIYVPFEKFDNLTKNSPKSVMFWIYGGAFLTGSIFRGQFNASYLSLMGDVIVVEVNYRLSAFGFLYDGSDEAPGNQAFTDFINALEFVQKNIEFFGGNPKSVTIFGESAGSMSVSALILMNRPELFQRAIMQSGSVNSYLGSQSNESALIKAQELAKYFNCFNNISNKINISCLRGIEGSKIADFCDKYSSGAGFFTPIYGDKLLPIKPSISLQNGKFNKNVELLFGVCNDEGAGFVSGGIPIPDMSPDSPDNSMTVAKSKLLIQLFFNALKVPHPEQVAQFYTKGLTDKDGLALKHAISDAFGDYQLTCPTIEFGKQIANYSKAYSYRLTFTTNKKWTGVMHGADVQYVFGAPFRHIHEYNEEEKQLSLAFIELWTTFAKTGEPKYLPKITEWPEAIDKNSTKPSVRYLTLNPNSYKVIDNAYEKNCGFWRSLPDL